MSDDEINEIREYFLNYHNKSSGDFHNDDVERVKRCDWVIRRFLDYYEIVNHKIDIQATAKQLIDAMKWRKEQKVNELKASDFPIEFFQCGGMFLYGEDKSGARLMISRVKINKKIKEWISLFKKFIIYQLEQVFRESDDCKIIVIGDCTDAGISNVDMDLTFFTISILRNYYPMILKSILVYELPWVLNYVVKLVYSLLAEDFKQLIHLIKKKELNNYIDQNQLPDFLDGTCELSYKTAPKGVQSARVLGHQLKISESAIDKLIKHLEPYILGDQTTI